MKKLSRKQFLSQLPEIDQQARDTQEPIMWMRLTGDDKAQSVVIVPGWPAAIQVLETDLRELSDEGYIQLEQRTSSGGIMEVTGKGRGGSLL
jgi:hypothetical protein